MHFALETHLFRDSNGISSKICSIIGRGAKRGGVPTGVRVFCLQGTHFSVIGVVGISIILFAFRPNSATEIFQATITHIQTTYVAV